MCVWGGGGDKTRFYCKLTYRIAFHERTDPVKLTFSPTICRVLSNSESKQTRMQSKRDNLVTSEAASQCWCS